MYFVVFQPCKDGPCNKGLCLPINDTSHRCICPKGYIINSTGGCTEDICSNDPCGPGVCLPNGTGSYYCECPEGYISLDYHCSAMQIGSTGAVRNLRNYNRMHCPLQIVQPLLPAL